MDMTADRDKFQYEHHLHHRSRANHRIFWATWFAITFALLTIALGRGLSWWKRRRTPQHQYELLEPGQRPPNHISRATVCFKARLNKPLSRSFQRVVPAPTFGGFLLLTIYLVVAFLSTTIVDAPFSSQHYLDDLAFRAAWITLTQVPLVYLLSAKRGPVSLVAGISYERINYIHRWVGRILFLSATMHAGIMKASISTSDIIRSRDKSIGIVRYGVGAYATLLWIAMTSVLPVRRWSHRVFYINHWISTIGFLIIVTQHIPNYARPPIFIAGAILAMDKCLVLYHLLRNNVSFRPLRRRIGRFGRKSERGLLVSGYAVEMTAPTSSILGLPIQTKDAATVIRIPKVPFNWKPGQHVRLYVPALGVFESHPFTPANCSALPPPPLPPRKDIERGNRMRLLRSHTPAQTSEMLLIVRAKSGLTRRLANYHAEWLTRPCPNASEAPSPLIAYIDGPHGNAPEWEKYENLILVATSTGVSFMLSILDHLEQLCFTGTCRLSTQHIRFIWATRHIDPLFEDTVSQLLSRYSTILREIGITIQADFFTTCPDSTQSEMQHYDQFSHLRQHSNSRSRSSSKPPLRIRDPEEIYNEWNREADIHAAALRRVDPFGTLMEGSERWSFESDESSESGTLVDGGEGDPFADAYAAEGHDDAYRLMPRSGLVGSSVEEDEEDDCQCAIMQHQRHKLKSARASCETITRWHGVRPDISYTMAEAVPSTSADSTMVAVCAHDGISRELQNAVSNMNMEFARRRRQALVDIHVEGFQ
ncbi:hypothetical protein T440DRAFT_283945 [Plenodomus tracheiphilus IPT5]|uniref:FAD-binding FR-type domain-containing protein n=1 Tax=Plenodomus tracheiphilus IPT5 TaxID=1408161 RepID=A0A6A7APD1_9PLEO|nr:hypothetical protein T440DRAFT_283945 [Plenodomus tracheiphilus IPT5]